MTRRILHNVNDASTLLSSIMTIVSPKKLAKAIRGEDIILCPTQSLPDEQEEAPYHVRVQSQGGHGRAQGGEYVR